MSLTCVVLFHECLVYVCKSGEYIVFGPNIFQYFSSRGMDSALICCNLIQFYKLSFYLHDIGLNFTALTLGRWEIHSVHVKSCGHITSKKERK